MMRWRWQMAQQAEIRWWQWYLRRQRPEVYRQQKIRYWRQVLAETEVEVSRSHRILDAGCGPAGIFMIFDDQPVHAVDPLLEDYEKSLPHFHRGDYPDVTFFPVALEDFTVEETYDRVFCLNAINHVEDLDKCLDKLAEAVTPGGRLLLSVDAHNHLFFRSLFRLLPLDILHPHQYDLKEYQAMLEDREFKIDRVVRLKSGFFFDYYGLVVSRRQ